MKKGEAIDNKALRVLFDAPMKGRIRECRTKPALVLVSDQTKRPAADQWRGDVLYFSGSGNDVAMRQVGPNRRLADSSRLGLKVHLFNVFIPGRYEYFGVMELAGDPYQEERADSKGAVGWVWVFPLRRARASKSPELIRNRKLPYGCYAVIGNNRDPEKVAATNAHLDALKELGVVVLDQRNLNQARWESEMAEAFGAITRHMEQHVKRTIREQKGQASRSNLRWGFDPDELEFDGTEERVMEILKILGREAEFNEIRTRAERLVRYPDSANF